MAGYFPVVKRHQMQAASWSLLLLMVALQAWGQSPDTASLDAIAGQALFEKNWVQAPSSTRSSDGLGPHFSNRSCAACHPGGGRGSGPQSNTLQLNDPVYGLRLHPFSLALVPREATLEWVQNQPPKAGFTLNGQSGWHPAISTLAYGDLHSALSVRQAPSLLGLGLLESVPTAALIALADPEDENKDGISGRVAWGKQTDQGLQAGRFGWKAGTASLASQAAQALSLDIGISNPQFPDPWGDCSATQTACRDLATRTASRVGQEAGLEANQTVLDLLVAYLRSLQAPAPLTGPQTAHNLFQRIGCANCHVPELPSSGGPVLAYTDLLLHDMGPELDDGLAEGAADSAEWRTAPLWSLPAAGPFLHDGRAASLDEVIALHGGEAGQSRAAYRQLNESDKASLLVLLLGL